LKPKTSGALLTFVLSFARAWPNSIANLQLELEHSESKTKIQTQRRRGRYICIGQVDTGALILSSPARNHRLFIIRPWVPEKLLASECCCKVFLVFILHIFSVGQADEDAAINQTRAT